MDSIDDKRFYKRVIFIVIAFMVVVNIGGIITGVNSVLKILFPLFVGAVMAFIINIPMKRLEKLYFPRSRNRFVNGSRRIVCILASILFIIAVFVIIINMVIPEIVSAAGVMVNNIPVYFDKAIVFISEQLEAYPDITKKLAGIKVNWDSVLEKAYSYVTGGIGAVLSSTMLVAGMVSSFVIDFVMALIFAIYLLLAKEDIMEASRRILKVFVQDKKTDMILHASKVINDTFAKFIAGQCIEAVILGCMCVIGMLIIRLPYAGMVGTVMGATALIPMLGAYIGAVLGAFLIFTVSPVKALIFIVFTVILQQIEGNLVYPKVVGNSIGLPGILVFMAVLIGGGVAGIPGMLIGVPMTAAGFKLFKEYLEYRERR